MGGLNHTLAGHAMQPLKTLHRRLLAAFLTAFDNPLPFWQTILVYQGHLDLSTRLYWTVEDVISPEECRGLMARIEKLQPRRATIDAPGGPVLNAQIRNNDRVTFDDHAWAKRLFQRLQPHLPPKLSCMSLFGVNERFRGYRYQAGQAFRPHYDGSFVRNEDERSLLTLLVYLCDVPLGGETRFLELGATITPKPGRALLFQHRLLHEGADVQAGHKYVLRSDIMYRRLESCP